MNARRPAESILMPRAKRPTISSDLAALSAAAPAISTLLPKVVPFVSRIVRRNPAQAVISIVGLAILARQIYKLGKQEVRIEPPLLK